LIKLDDTGKLVWEHSFGGVQFDAAQAITPSKNGGFFIVGNSKSDNQDAAENAGENDIWIMKIDADGNLVWQKSFGGADLDFGFDVLESKDGSIFVVGETASTDFPSLTSKGKTDLVVLKVK